MPAPEGNQNAALPPDLRRDELIRLRVTTTEKEKIRQAAAKRTLTQYIRDRLGL